MDKNVSKAPDNMHHLFDSLADYSKYYEVVVEHIACAVRLLDVDVVVDMYCLQIRGRDRNHIIINR